MVMWFFLVLGSSGITYCARSSVGSPAFGQNKKSQGITVSGMLWLFGSCINSSIRHFTQIVQSFLMQEFCLSKIQVFSTGNGPVFCAGITRRTHPWLVHIKYVIAALVVKTGTVPVQTAFAGVVTPRAGTILQVWQIGCTLFSSDCSGLLSISVNNS
jgi:hypothetical protein